MGSLSGAVAPQDGSLGRFIISGISATGGGFVPSGLINAYVDGEERLQVEGRNKKRG
jgi:hypothetical protein